MAKALTENIYFDDLRTLADRRTKWIMNQKECKTYGLLLNTEPVFY